MSKNLNEKLRRLNEIKKNLLGTDTCVAFVQKGGLSELMTFLPSIENKNAKDREIIGLGLENLLRISVECFKVSVPKQTQSICTNSLKKISGYSILNVLFKTYSTEIFKENIAIILGRFHDGLALPSEFQPIVPALRNIIIKYSSKEMEDKSRIDLALVALTSIASHQDNKKLLIQDEITNIVFGLLISDNSNIVIHSLTLLSSFCDAGTAEEKNEIIASSIFQIYLTPLHRFSLSLPLDLGGSGDPVPPAAMVNNICCLFGKLIADNPKGVANFLRSGLVPVLVYVLHAPPRNIAAPSFRILQTTIFQIFTACATDGYASTDLLLSCGVLPYAVDAVLEYAAQPPRGADDGVGYTAVDLLYTAALKGAGHVGVVSTPGADPAADDGEEEDGDGGRGSKSAQPNPLDAEYYEPFGGREALYALFKTLHGMPAGQLTPSNREVLQQAALAVALLLCNTHPSTETYSELIAYLTEQTNLKGARNEAIASLSRSALAGLGVAN